MAIAARLFKTQFRLTQEKPPRKEEAPLWNLDDPL
jgi:hypothetical protein